MCWRFCLHGDLLTYYYLGVVLVDFTRKFSLGLPKGALRRIRSTALIANYGVVSDKDAILFFLRFGSKPEIVGLIV